MDYIKNLVGGSSNNEEINNSIKEGDYVMIGNGKHIYKIIKVVKGIDEEGEHMIENDKVFIQRDGKKMLDPVSVFKGEKRRVHKLVYYKNRKCIILGQKGARSRKFMDDYQIQFLDNEEKISGVKVKELSITKQQSPKKSSTAKNNSRSKNKVRSRSSKKSLPESRPSIMLPITQGSVTPLLPLSNDLKGLREQLQTLKQGRNPWD